MDYADNLRKCILTYEKCYSCYNGVCYNDGPKCAQKDCRKKGHGCSYECSQNESNPALPLNINSSLNVKINLSYNDIPEINSQLKSFKSLSNQNLYNITTPTYISIQSLLI